MSCTSRADEQFGHGHDPQRVVGVVRAEEHRDMNGCPRPVVEHEAQQDGARVKLSTCARRNGVVIPEIRRCRQSGSLGCRCHEVPVMVAGPPGAVGAVRALGIKSLHKDRLEVCSASMAAGRRRYRFIHIEHRR